MSAFLVDRAHIDALVKAGFELFRGTGGYYHAGLWRKPDDDTLGRILWTENLESLAYRYPADESSERPGPNGLADSEIFEYTYTPRTRRLGPVEVLKACDGLEYQSCEHPGWERSEAKAILDALRKAATRALPGYEEADWVIRGEPASRH